MKRLHTEDLIDALPPDVHLHRSAISPIGWDSVLFALVLLVGWIVLLILFPGGVRNDP